MPDFRLKCQKVHLTYKTHIPIAAFKAQIVSKVGADNVKMLSFVHEEGDEDEDHPTPYEHTHVFVWTKKAMETENARYFDVKTEDGAGVEQIIHPNIQNKRGLDWAKTIVFKYHLGHKTKKDGKKYFIEPIMLHQEGVEEWKMDSDAYAIAINAPTLVDAALDLGVQVKSLSDIKLVRQETKKRKADTIDDDADPANFKAIPWDRKKALILRGPAGTCKTNWAIYQFKAPIKIEDLDELKDMPDDCDGIIFDECLFDKCSKKTMISLLDYKQDRTIRTRNTNAKIPRGMSKIFTCNEHEHPFGHDPAYGGHPSVTSRFNLIDVKPGDLVTSNVAR